MCSNMSASGAPAAPANEEEEEEDTCRRAPREALTVSEVKPRFVNTGHSSSNKLASQDLPSRGLAGRPAVHAMLVQRQVRGPKSSRHTRCVSCSQALCTALLPGP